MSFTNRFYQEEYREGFTTTLPDELTLNRLIEQKFKGGEKDYSSYISVLESLGICVGANVLDFGCSWGYGSWQLMEHGYRVVGVEIGSARAKFARTRLGVDVRPTLYNIHETFDAVFSSHVLEHVPQLAEVLRALRRVLRRGGLFVAFLPNGGEEYRRKNPTAWQSSWGFLHPILPDARFFEHNFSGDKALVCSAPYDIGGIRTWARSSDQAMLKLDLTGSELLFAFQKPQSSQ